MIIGQEVESECWKCGAEIILIIETKTTALGDCDVCGAENELELIDERW